MAIKGVKTIDARMGLDTARAGEALPHVLDDLRDVLLICLLKRLSGPLGRVSIPASELDATGLYTVAMSFEAGFFDFTISRKD